MRFYVPELTSILETQEAPVSVFDANERMLGSLAPIEAAKITEGGAYVGIGHKRRIRFIQPINMRPRWLGKDGTRPTRGDSTCRNYGPGQLMGASESHREFAPLPR